MYKPITKEDVWNHYCVRDGIAGIIQVFYDLFLFCVPLSPRVIRDCELACIQSVFNYPSDTASTTNSGSKLMNTRSQSPNLVTVNDD